MQGVSGEDKIELNKEEARAVKLRSRKLLFSLIYPVRGRLLLSLLIVVLSQALRVAGPALIALGIDWALPAALKSDSTPLFCETATVIPELLNELAPLILACNSEAKV